MSCISKGEPVWYERNLDIRNPVRVFAFDEFQTVTDCAIEDRQQIASYNWFGDKKAPVIIVPGAPRRLSFTKTNELHRDSGLRFVDRNIEFMGRRPLDPIFYACDNVDTKINFQEIQIVSDRSNLTKLFDALSTELWSPTTPFRIELRCFGKCVLFFVNVEDSREDALSTDPSYGVDFKETFTKETNSLTSGPFFQISKLKFADLKMVIRFGVDGAEFDQVDQCDQKIGLFKPCELPHTSLKIIRWGSSKNRRLVELKTRRCDKGVPKQLWFLLYLAGIYRFVMARYQKLTDNKTVEIKGMVNFRVQDRMKKPRDLHLLYNCLMKVVAFAQNDPNKVFYLLWRCEKPKEFNLYEATDVSVCCDVSEYVKSLIMLSNSCQSDDK